jgi:hypothetical protein
VTGVVSDDSGTLRSKCCCQRHKGSAQTNFNGEYSIKAKTGDVLVFSFVGMAESTTKVGSSSTINIKMQVA